MMSIKKAAPDAADVAADVVADVADVAANVAAADVAAAAAAVVADVADVAAAADVAVAAVVADVAADVATAAVAVAADVAAAADVADVAAAADVAADVADVAAVAADVADAAVDIDAPQLPAPIIDDVNRPYWQGCEQGLLLLQHCRACGRLSCPPQDSCPACGGDCLDWQAASGRARLWSWVSLHRSYFPHWPQPRPYTVILAQLEEGPIIISSLLDAPPALELGMELQLRFDQGLPKFVPR